MEYSRIFGSQYPNEQMSVSEKKDIDNSILSQVLVIEQYISKGELSVAKSFLEANASTLEPYLIDSNFFNLLQEEIYNIGLYAISRQNTLVSNKQPTTQSIPGSYWIEDIEMVE